MGIINDIHYTTIDKLLELKISNKLLKNSQNSAVFKASRGNLSDYITTLRITDATDWEITWVA